MRRKIDLRRFGSSRSRRVLPWMVAGLLICALLGGCNRHIKAYLARGGAQSPTAEQCGECHLEIYQEWKGSAHARSYRSPDFRRITADYRIEECLPCHAPEPILAGGEVRLRSWRREEGVTCVSCHWLNDRLHGPLEIANPFPPHPVGENDRRFRQSDLCGRCHREVLKEWEAWKGAADPESSSELAPGSIRWQALEKGPKPTCQDCHMPERGRKLIQDLPWRWIQPRHRTGRHTWDPREDRGLVQAVALEILVDEGPAGEPAPERVNPGVVGRVRVRNRGVGHALPTGAYGYAEVALLITLEDPWETALARQVHSFYQELKTSLRAGEERMIPYRFPNPDGKGVKLRAQLVRTSFDRKDRWMIARAERVLMDQTVRKEGR